MRISALSGVRELGFRLRLLSFVMPAALLAACSGASNIAPTASGGSALSSSRGTAAVQGRAISPVALTQAHANAATGSYGFTGMRAVFEHSLVCDNGILIANFAQAYGIKTLYIPVAGDDISSLLAANPTTVNNLNAMTAVATVYIVTGDNSWISTPTTVPADVPSLASIATLYPQIAGILYAIDPVQLSTWNSNQRSTLIANYLTLEQTLLTAGGTAFPATLFTADTKFATTHITSNPHSATLLEQMQSPNGVTGVDLVVPGNTATMQLSNAASSIPQLTKPFTIEASASAYSKNSYYTQSSASLNSNLTQVAETIASENPNFTSIEVNGWSDLYTSLNGVLPQPPVFNGTLASGPLVPAAGQTYLGGYIDPAGSGPSEAQTETFEGQIGRTLAFDMSFTGFRQQFPTSNYAADIAHGRIPLIAWNCGDPDAVVASGADDSIIIAHAKALKAVGSPVMIRWFWEMNLNDTNNPPRLQCYDPATDLPGGYFSPQNYIAAFRHIHQLFVEQGATNVIWLFVVANAHGGPSQYYPGDDVVDWVGMDDYDTNDYPSMYNTFFIQANELSQFQEKPFMVTETGAHADTQVSYFSNAVQVLQNQFPWVRAIGYLDALGSHQNWVLTGDGLTSFSTFANDPYLSAMAATP